MSLSALRWHYSMCPRALHVLCSTSAAQECPSQLGCSSGPQNFMNWIPYVGRKWMEGDTRRIFTKSFRTQLEGKWRELKESQVSLPLCCRLQLMIGQPTMKNNKAGIIGWCFENYWLSEFMVFTQVGPRQTSGWEIKICSRKNVGKDWGYTWLLTLKIGIFSNVGPY